MTTERDELAKVLQAATKAPCPIGFWSRAYDEPTGYGELFADAILDAGYRKPRTVTTVEELDALPEGSIILDSDPDALLKVEGGQWRSLIDPDEPFKSLYLSLPATVLHEGDACSDLRKAIEELAERWEKVAGTLYLALTAPKEAEALAGAANELRKALTANPEPEPEWGVARRYRHDDKWSYPNGDDEAETRDEAERNIRSWDGQSAVLVKLVKRAAPGPWIEVEGNAPSVERSVTGWDQEDDDDE